MGANFLGLTAFVLSVEGDVPVDSGAPMVTSSISRICRLSLSEVLIGVGLRACIHRDECACVFVSRQIFEIDEVTTGAPLSTGMSPTTESTNAVKF